VPNIPFEEVTTSTLDGLAPLPKHTDPQLHPQDLKWYRATITFEVEILPQPRMNGSDSTKGGGKR
jgi:hypothetical protein